MPVFDGKHLTERCEDEAFLAMVLHATPKARADARERGRMRVERASMRSELTPAVPGTRRACPTPSAILPVT